MTVHFVSNDRPVCLKTVHHFKDRPLSPFWAVNFDPDSTYISDLQMLFPILIHCFQSKKFFPDVLFCFQSKKDVNNLICFQCMFLIYILPYFQLSYYNIRQNTSPCISRCDICCQKTLAQSWAFGKFIFIWLVWIQCRSRGLRSCSDMCLWFLWRRRKFLIIWIKRSSTEVFKNENISEP